MAATLIERYGKLYTGGDVKVRMLNRTIDGITKITYGDTQEKSNVHGMNRLPVGRIRGKVDFQASITLKAFEVDALEAAAPGGLIRNIRPFDIGVSYLDENENIIKHDVLSFVEFTGASRDVNANDEIEIELELVVGNITPNV